MFFSVSNSSSLPYPHIYTHSLSEAPGEVRPSGFLSGCLSETWLQWERGEVSLQRAAAPPFPFQVVELPGNLWSDYQQTHTPIFCTVRYRFQRGRGVLPTKQNDSFQNSVDSLPSCLLHKERATTPPPSLIPPLTPAPLAFEGEATVGARDAGTQAKDAAPPPWESGILVSQIGKIQIKEKVCAPLRSFIIHTLPTKPSDLSNRIGMESTWTNY